LLACLDEKRWAQKLLFDRFSPMMKGVCLRYASCEEEANDLLQESMIRCFSNLQKFEKTGALGAWLRRITVNVCLEMYRKNQTRNQHLERFASENGNEPALDNALQRMALEELLKKIQSLPTGFRTVFNLYAIEGLTHPEIAEALGVTVGTSKSQYSRARQLLREMIEEENEQELKLLKHAK
jgi:RNA polymerase sigma factor (sigma-70 family)